MKAHRLAFERRVALLAAHGRRTVEIAESLGVNPSTISRTLNLPHVEEMVRQFMVQGDARLEEVLVQGEKLAGERLVQLVNSENEKIALEASIRLTDMAGKSGKPVERVQTQSVNLTGDAAQAALANAIRDPGVRAWLAANPDADKEVRALMAEKTHETMPEAEFTETSGPERAMGPP